MKRVFLACAVLATVAHFGRPIVGRVARTLGRDCVALDVLPEGIPDWHSDRSVFRALCLGLCPDLESTE
jgi:hypothetical protein